MHFRMVSSIPGLYPLDTGSNLTPSYGNNKMSPDIANYSNESQAKGRRVDIDAIFLKDADAGQNLNLEPVPTV